jgi:MFS family permease
MKIPTSRTSRRPKIFYGWYIVAALATVSMVSVGLGGMNFGLFIPSIHEELHISNAFFGWGQTARLLGFAVSSWFIGRILDHYGARVPMAVAATVLGLVMLCLSRIQNGWQMVGLFFVIGFIGLEGAGGNLYQSVPLSRWFIRKRGKAMSLAFLGTTAGMFVFTPLMQYMIATVGWRLTWVILGSGSCSIIILIALVVIRRDPQSAGLQPDGEAVEKGYAAGASDHRKMPPLAEYSWTRPQAVRNGAFWVLAVILGLRMFSTSTINMFRIPFFIEQGLPPHTVAWAISAEAVISALIAWPTGWALDRFQPRYVAGTSLVLFVAAFVMTMNVAAVWQMYLACGLFGISAASFLVAQNALWPAYFGGLYIGAIRGFAVPIAMVFSALGGPLTGFIKDATGSYKPAWTIAAVSLAISAVLMFLTAKPEPPAEPSHLEPSSLEAR